MLEPGRSISISSERGSKTTENVDSKLEQIVKSTKGQDLGTVNRVPLLELDILVLRKFQALDNRKDEAQSKVGDCRRRKEKKFIHCSGIMTEFELEEKWEKCCTQSLTASG